MADFGILNCIMMVAKSKSMLSLPSSTKGIPQIFAIFGTFPIYLTVFLVELKPNPTANFSNNTGYTFQLQASTQLTIPKIGTGP